MLIQTVPACTAGKRIEHVLTCAEVPREKHLHELRDELPEVRVEAVNVLRPLPLREVALGPRQLEVEVRVERFLRRSHDLRGSTPPSERLRQALQAARPLDNDVERHQTAGVITAIRREPHLCSTPRAAGLLRRHHLEWVAEAQIRL